MIQSFHPDIHISKNCNVLYDKVNYKLLVRTKNQKAHPKTHINRTMEFDKFYIKISELHCPISI